MYFKKNLWQRIKFAFKTLLSDAPLEEMCTTGYKAGVDEVINDYRLLKEKLVPILTELATHRKSWMIILSRIRICRYSN